MKIKYPKLKVSLKTFLPIVRAVSAFASHADSETVTMSAEKTRGVLLISSHRAKARLYFDCDVTTEGTFGSLNVTALAKLINSSRGETIEISSNRVSVTFTSDNSKNRLRILPLSLAKLAFQFSDMEKASVLPGDLLTTGMSKTKWCVAPKVDRQSKLFQTGFGVTIANKQLQVLACQDRGLAKYLAPLDTLPTSATYPPILMSMLSFLAPTECKLLPDGKLLYCQLDDHEIVLVSLKTPATNLDRMIKSQTFEQGTLTIQEEDIRDWQRRIRATCSINDATDKSVGISVVNGTLHLFSNSKGAKTKNDVQGEFAGDDISLRVNYKFLGEVIANLEGNPQIDFQGPRKLMRLKDDRCTFIITTDFPE